MFSLSLSLFLETIRKEEKNREFLNLLNAVIQDEQKADIFLAQGKYASFHWRALCTFGIISRGDLHGIVRNLPRVYERCRAFLFPNGFSQVESTRSRDPINVSLSLSLSHRPFHRFRLCLSSRTLRSRPFAEKKKTASAHRARFFIYYISARAGQRDGTSESVATDAENPGQNRGWGEGGLLSRRNALLDA